MLQLGTLVITLALASAAGAGGLRDPAELEAFLDGVIHEHVAEYGTPAVAVSVVKEGKPFFSKGYGFADLETRRPVDPETTIFPVFSVTKIFTAVALMQQAERGKVDFQRDVRQYCPDVPAFRGVRGILNLHQIFTHTTGLDKSLIGLAARGPDEVKPFAEFLRDHQLDRIEVPGTSCQYNIGYSYTAAGAVLESVTGLKYADYMQKSILDPLKMTHSRCALVPEQEADLAWGYLMPPVVPRATRLGRLYTNVVPAAALHTTANDMSHFMIAMLEGGAYQGNRILSAGSVDKLQGAQFAAHKSFGGVGYGLFRGPGFLEHAGGPFPHLACVLLVPRARVGVFFATSAVTGVKLLRGINNQFLKRYYPEALDWKLPAPGKVPTQDLSELEGTYRLRFYPRKGIDKLEMLLPFSVELNVKQADKDQLRVEHTLLPLQQDMTWCDRDLFARPDGLGPVAFERTARGTLLGFTTHPFMPYAVMPLHFEKITGWQSRCTAWLLIVVFLVTFLWIVLTAPFRVFGFLVGAMANTTSRLPLLHHLVRALSAALALALLSQPYLAIFPLVGPLPRFVFGMPDVVGHVAALGPWVALAGFAQLALCLQLWRRGRGTLVQRFAYTLTTVITILFLVFAREWNLMG